MSTEHPWPDEYPEGWVNAEITLVIPLDDVTVAALAGEKQDAVGRAMDRVIEALPPGLAEHVSTGRWEDMRPGSASPSPVVPVSALRDWIEEQQKIPLWKIEVSEGPMGLAHAVQSEHHHLSHLSVFLDTLERTER